MAHSSQPVACRADIFYLETLAVVLDVNGDVAFKVVQADLYLGGIGIFGDIGQ